MNQELAQRIREFLVGINLNTAEKREALLIWASLDQDLVSHIDCTGTPAQFITTVVHEVANYGQLEDGRDALEAVLAAAKTRVGHEGKLACDAIIEEWRRQRAIIANNDGDVNVTEQKLDYKYDVFLSYGHGSIFSKWVNEIFIHRLEGYLREYLVRPVHIRIGDALSPDAVPSYTKIALTRSRCLVSICYPSYFQTPQCTYEMAVMLQRETRLGYKTQTNPTALVLPVHVFDGDCFPDIISLRESRCDCNGLTSISVDRSERGVVLDDKIVQFAMHVASTIDKAPPWDETFYDDLVPNDDIRASLQTSSRLTTVPRW